MSTTTIYTDGACAGNPGPGGWAWAVPGGPFASGAEAHSTNQRMEISAALEALRANDGNVKIVSDSTYVVKCFNDRWYDGWLKRGWTNAAKKPVANRDLWEPFIALYLQRKSEITFEWVKGHGTDPTNDLVDRLAVEAARSQRGRTGVGMPEDLGAADDAGSPDAAARDPRLPSGRMCLVAGLKPPALGGYAENPITQGVREKMCEILVAKKSLHPNLHVLTGLDLGAEQLGAQAAIASDVPYVAVLLYADFDAKWPEPTKRVFRDLVDQAAKVVTLESKAPAVFAAGMNRRNAWLTTQCDEAFVVWDGKDPHLAKTVHALEDRLGAEVWIIEPQR